MVDFLGFESTSSAKILRDEYFQRYHSTMKGLNVAMQEGRLPKPFYQEQLGQYWADHCDFARFLHADPRQVEVIRSLSQDVGLKIAVFTNSPRQYALRCLDALGLRAFVPDEMVFAVEDVLPACKPQPEAFKKVLDAIGAAPQRTVMFEDSMKNIRACKASGQACQNRHWVCTRCSSTRPMEFPVEVKLLCFMTFRSWMTRPWMWRSRICQKCRRPCPIYGRSALRQK
ncbi:unnamed protein product [Effrenium voratum]|nr:unnamed protein product [Effrenium voratum]